MLKQACARHLSHPHVQRLSHSTVTRHLIFGPFVQGGQVNRCAVGTFLPDKRARLVRD